MTNQVQFQLFFESRKGFGFPNSIDRIDNWRCLLCFGAVILKQPRHGGKHHNLTSIIKKRTTEFFDTWRIKSEVIFGDEIQSNHARNGKTLNNDESIRAAVSAKLEDGNIKAAARILCSGETPAAICDQTFADLQSKHPSPRPDNSPVPPPPSVQPIQ